MREEKPFRINATLNDFRGWLESYLRSEKALDTLFETVFQRASDGRMALIYYLDNTKYAVQISLREVAAEVLELQPSLYPMGGDELDNEIVVEHFDRLLENISVRWLPPPLAFSEVISDTAMATVLSDRWSESFRVEQVDAHLSALILLGSVLEGILVSRCEQDPRTANRSKSAPRAAGKVKSFSEWKLSELINVAHEVGWIGSTAKSLSHLIREQRNLVHPKQFVYQLITIDAATVKTYRELVKVIISDMLAKTSKN